MKGIDECAVCIDFGPWPRINAIYASFVKTKFLIGFKSAEQYRHFIYDCAVLHSNQKHELENFRALLAPLNIKPSVNPALKIPQLKFFLDVSLDKSIIIHPFPGGFKSYMKEWKIERWKSLITCLTNEGYTILITGSKQDVEKSNDIMALLSENTREKCFAIAGKLTIEELVSLINRVTAVVCVNTGIAHIAAALNKPTVTLHGPTSVSRWGPINPNGVSISPKSTLCGYLNFGFEYHRAKIDCMDLITNEEVEEAILNLLKKAPAK
jgi:heptosyltransferase I